MCRSCRGNATAARIAEQERLAARTVLLSEAASVVGLVNRFQADMRFPTILCRADAEHGPVEASVYTETVTAVLACGCGWAEPVPADHVEMLQACVALSASTVGLYGLVVDDLDD